MVEQHRKLIEALLQSTKKGLMKWSKQHHYAFYSYSNKLKFLLDKYYSIVDDQEITCVNLTIFKNDNNIIDELVVCTADEDEREDFNLFDELYKEVIKQLEEAAQKTIYPIITEITNSLEKNLEINSP